MEPVLGEIRMFAGNFAPRGWAFCEGQLLAISQNDALFSLIGTIYGGDGRTTFALPDLRGRIPVHAGTGPGLNNYRLGEKTGAEKHALTIHELPAHNHGIIASNSPATDITPSGLLIGQKFKGFSNTTNGNMNSEITTSTGKSTPFDIQEPSLCLNFIIATIGTYPSRN